MVGKGLLVSLQQKIACFLIEIFMPKWSNVNIFVIFTYVSTSSLLSQVYIAIHLASYFFYYLPQTQVILKDHQ